MSSFRPLLVSVAISFLFISCLPFSFSANETVQDPGKSNDTVLTDNSGEEQMVLAPRKTYRKDPLDDFKMYTGGWNISSRHYWSSVSYTAAPLFAVATIWFVVFGLLLSLICVRYCCCRRQKSYDYSGVAYAVSFVFLASFSLVSVIGCVVVYTGQEKFGSATTGTLEYVAHQADETSQNLHNISEYLSEAKQFNVVQVTLPPNVQTDIDQIQSLIDSSATTLTSKTRQNSEHIKNITESLVFLFVLSAAMLLLTFLGFVLSIFGKQTVVYILVVAAWILVTATFVLSGVFLLLHNVTGDTCAAMRQWVQNPTAHTALGDVLPCVDAHDSLLKSKEVTSQLVDAINTVITNVSNINFAPNFQQLYFNQSGPTLPTLCNPFHPDLTDRACSPGEVDLANATQVWSGYVCQTSVSGICFTTGRLNPVLYSEFSSTVKVGYGLEQCGSFLVQLAECSYAMQTFSDIEETYCPGLRKYSKRVHVGVAIVGTAVMVSILCWVIYARERRHRVYSKAKMERPDGGFVYAKGE